MKDLILGSHLLFAREGATIDAITVSATSKPDADPESNYTRLGTVEQMEPRFTQTFIDRRAPSPGRYRLRKRIPTNQLLVLNFSLQEWDEMALAEMLLGGGTPVAGVFVPGSRTEPVRGWWKIQAYDQVDTEILVMDVWAEGTIESYQFGEKLDAYALVLTVLQSDLNVGEVGNLTAPEEEE